MDEVSRKVQKASTHSSCIAMDVAARHGHSAAKDGDATALHPENTKRQFSGAMDERTRTVHKASTHVFSCVAANGASVKGHGANPDVYAAALNPKKEMSIQRGDG